LLQNDWCSFCPKKYKQPAPSNVFLNGVRVQFLNQVKYLGVWISASLKDDDDIQRQVKSLFRDNIQTNSETSEINIDGAGCLYFFGQKRTPIVLIVTKQLGFFLPKKV